MNILFVLENYYPHIGGVETLFKGLTEGLAALGHQITVVTHRMKGTKKSETINGVKIYRVSCFQSRYLFTVLSLPNVLVLSKKADIIHTSTYTGTLSAKIASSLLTKPCIITVPEILGQNWENFEMNYFSKKIHRLLEQIIIRLHFDMYISISGSTEKNVLEQGIHPSKSKVIYCGIDYTFFNPKLHDGTEIRKNLGLKDNFVYLFYGRPGISKGLEYLISAVNIISEEIPGSRLLAIVSKDITYSKRYTFIMDLIKRLDVSDKIVLLNSVPYAQLPSYISASDCVVVPSLTEGFGFCAAEVCAMGKAVVASDTTSLPEVVSGQFVLVKTKDPASIAEGVRKVYDKNTSHTPLKKFEIKDFIQSYIGVYEGILSGTAAAKIS